MNIPALVFLAICLAISGYAGRLFVHGIRSRSWPCVPGRITTSRLEQMSGSGTGRSTRSAVFVLEYTYTVNGEACTGKRIAMAPRGWFSLGRPAELQKKYSGGKEVPVYYDPAKPTLCTLENGVPARAWTFYLIASLFALFAVVMVMSLLSSLR
jgi:Protein of unknown function (DUF3592)